MTNNSILDLFMRIMSEIDPYSKKLWEKLGLNKKGTGLVKGKFNDIECEFVAFPVKEINTKTTKIVPMMIILNPDLVQHITGPDDVKFYT